MKVVILNAGFGSRLGKNIPKGLVQIEDNKTILDLQIRCLLNNFDLDYDDINIVIGFKKELFIEKYDFLSLIINNDYKNTGPRKSLLTGLNEIKSDNVLWINGDVVFDDYTIKLLKDKLDQNLIVVNGNLANMQDEEYKISVGNNGYINRISKDNKNACGFHIGINYIKKEYLDQFKYYLDMYKDQIYFDVAIQSIIDKGVKFVPFDIQNNFCMEIDHKEELEIAKDHIFKDIKI
jgi:choline kinase